MKVLLMVCMFPLLLTLGICQTNQPGGPKSKELSPGLKLPYGMTVVESTEKQEVNEITNKVLTYLNSRDYVKLDDYAVSLRTSKESRANGNWKLGDLYFGITPPDTASDADWEKRIVALKEWGIARTNSMTARVALAYALTDYAWEARGSGWADTVSAQGWKLFDERLRRAIKVLDDAKDLKEKCPVYWSVRMRCALGLNFDKETFDDIFKKATNSTPGYLPYYFRRAVYLLPRWHGEPGEWESDLTKQADLIGGQNGDEMYAQVVWLIHQNVSSTNLFKEYKLSWPRVDKGFDAITKRYPESLAAKNERAHLAVLARDKEAARKYFDQCEGKIEPSVWHSTATVSRMLMSAYAGQNRVSTTNSLGLRLKPGVNATNVSMRDFN